MSNYSTAQKDQSQDRYWIREATEDWTGGRKCGIVLYIGYI